MRNFTDVITNFLLFFAGILLYTVQHGYKESVDRRR